jgi:hypothetical protein
VCHEKVVGRRSAIESRSLLRRKKAGGCSAIAARSCKVSN